mgnify:CR=1 FL=1
MNVKQLRIFLAVAHTQSFAEASKLVHMSQPAVSLSIKSLEDSLGGRLFTRTTRSTLLTAEGQKYAVFCSFFNAQSIDVLPTKKP